MYYRILSTGETLVSPKPARITSESTIIYSPHGLTKREIVRFHTTQIILVAQRLKKRGKLIPYLRFLPNEIQVIPYNQVPATLLWVSAEEDPETCELGEIAKSRYIAKSTAASAPSKNLGVVKHPDSSDWKRSLEEFDVPGRRKPTISYDRALREVDNLRKEFVFKYISQHGTLPNPKVCAYRWHLTESAALRIVNSYGAIWNSLSPAKVTLHRNSKSNNEGGGRVYFTKNFLSKFSK